MKKFQLDEVQFEKLEQAQNAPLGRDAAVKRLWQKFGEELGFDPATATPMAEDWTFEAEPLAQAQQPAGAQEASSPAPATPEEEPGQQEAAATPVSAAEPRGVPHADFDPVVTAAEREAAGDLVKRENPEVVELVRVAKESALSMESAFELVQRFAPLAAEMKATLATAKTIQVTSEEQGAAMAMARTTRLALRDIRLRSEKLRKGLKEDSLKRGRAIDGLHNVLAYAIAPEEARLEDAEKFAERAVAERLRLLAQQRFEALMKYNFNPGAMDLGAMTKEDFDLLLEGQRLAFEAAQRRKIEAKTVERREQLAAYGVSPTAQVMVSPDLGALPDDKFALVLAEHKRLHEQEQERKRTLRYSRSNLLGTWGVTYSGTTPIEELDDETFSRIEADAKGAWNAKKDREQAERDRLEREKVKAQTANRRLALLSRFNAQVSSSTVEEQTVHTVIYADQGGGQLTADLGEVPEAEFEIIASNASNRFVAEKARVDAERKKQQAEKEEADRKAQEEKRRADEAQAELDRQKKAKAEADRKAKAEEARLARAPDKQKLVAFLKSINSITAPEMKTEVGRDCLEAIREQYKLAAEFASKLIAEL